MTDLTPNLPEVVAEVGALFERYEQALIDKSVDVLDATFWNSPHAIRLANHEHGYGFDRIHAHRVARVPGPGTKEKRLRLDIVTVGRDVATVTLVYKVRVLSGWYLEPFKPQPNADILKHAVAQANAGNVGNGFFPVNAKLEDFINRKVAPGNPT